MACPGWWSCCYPNCPQSNEDTDVRLLQRIWAKRDMCPLRSILLIWLCMIVRAKRFWNLQGRPVSWESRCLQPWVWRQNSFPPRASQSFLSLSFLNLCIFNWRITALQCCVGFCHTLTCISHWHTYLFSLWAFPPNPVFALKATNWLDLAQHMKGNLLFSKSENFTVSST